MGILKCHVHEKFITIKNTTLQNREKLLEKQSQGFRAPFLLRMSTSFPLALHFQTDHNDSPVGVRCS